LDSPSTAQKALSKFESLLLRSKQMALLEGYGSHLICFIENQLRWRARS
jgi:hypothetical protein